MKLLPLKWSSSKRGYLIAMAYLAIFGLAFEAALQLRFGFMVPAEMRTLAWHLLPWIMLTKLLVFYLAGSFHGWWRFVTFSDLTALLRAATLSSLVIVAIDHFLIWNYQIPRATLVIDWGVTIVLTGGLRSTWRLVREHRWAFWTLNGSRRAFMIGADHGGEGLIQQIRLNPRIDYRIVGFLDENHSHHGSRLRGIPFLGSPEQAVRLAEKHNVKALLVIARSISGNRLRSLMEECQVAGIEVKMIPPLDELLSSSYRVQVRDIDINDLLRREPVQLDDERIGDMVRGRRVLVTGAGGSIGSEICRQVAEFEPERIVLLERAENSLFYIEQELASAFPDLQLVPCVADICDRNRLRTVFETQNPQIVFHAAAHKHVPLMESNVGEAVKNNVLGTRMVAEMARLYSVRRFVMISTDKAVGPTSVMGVTKQLAERYVQKLPTRSPTKFVTVRFGNVLASAGSVVPIFQQQIKRGGPITVTHPDMKRFFMTIPEACQLVLQAAAVGQGGEIFVLDMGDQVKIVDLATDLIRLSGLSSDDIDITFTGLRPGEKLSERLWHEDEQIAPTSHPKLRVVSPRENVPDLNGAIAELAELVDGPADAILDKLMQLVPEYDPDGATSETPASSETMEVTSTMTVFTDHLQSREDQVAGTTARTSSDPYSADVS